MGDEIFSVYLIPADYSKLAYAKLDLPASPWKLLDTLDKVRLPEGDSLYLEITDYRDFEVLRSSLVCSATNLLELNDLAERLSRLNEVQRIAFEGLVRVDFQKQESITLKRLRDLAESVDCCHVVESVVSDGQLGRFYAENGFVPEVEGMSDAAFELLDFEKVGKMARMGECGVYVPSGISGLGGYVVQHSDLKSAPEITLNQPVEPAYTIHLRLTAHHDNLPFAGTDVVDLKLPAEDNALEMAVRCLGYVDWGAVECTCLDCKVPQLAEHIKKNYGAEGAEVIVDNCQVNLYGGFAPASQTAVELSKALGSRTVMSGSISRGKNDPSQSLQMIERPLMTPDELKSMPKGSFIVAKTGVHPMKVKLRLFLDWGIRFGEPYEVPEKAQRAVAYADKQELEESIIRRHYGTVAEEEPPQDVPAAVGGMNHGMQAEKNSRKTILRP